jgi:ABC-type transport system involved in multi-copper enzyme maturation permease subunit
MGFGTGPVFAYERLTASRRWQNYGLRSFGVAALLVAMGTIASARGAFFEGSSVNTLDDYAKLGESYLFAIIGVELALVMLAAPAATAGAICVDRSRGTLEHMMATDLSDSEIVLDKLASRLMPVLGLIACSMPVLALATLLGGVDLFALAVGFLVVASVAVFGCSLALALSVWARKPYEVVLAMYSVWAIVLLGPSLWERLAHWRFLSAPPEWIVLANPFYVAFAPYSRTGGLGPVIYLGFFAAALGLSLIFVLLTIGKVRTASIRDRNREETAPRLSTINRIARRLPGPSLDRNPVLWREWHRTRTPRMSLFLIVLISMTTAACAFQAVSIWNIGLDRGGGWISGYDGLIYYLLPAFFGLLVLSATAPMSLSEERQRGSLDVLMATPLSTRSIVLAKWLSVFRVVPWLAVGPALLGLALALSPTLRSRHGFGEPPMDLSDRLAACGLLAATLLAHGAAMTTLGLCLATWVQRQGKAVGMNVTFFVLLSCAWPLVISMGSSRPTEPHSMRWDLLSPIVTVALVVDDLVGPVYHYRIPIGNIAICDVVMLLVSLSLLAANIGTFDRHMGRMPERRPLPEPEVPVDWPPTRRPGAREAGGRQNRAARPPSFS